jgi:hypothetical protein
VEWSCINNPLTRALQRRGRHLRREKARADAVDGDVVLGQRRRQCSGEVDHRALARVVRQGRHHARIAAAQSRHRGDVDDAAALAAFDHVQSDGAADEIRAVNVGSDHLVPRLKGHVLEGRTPGGAGVVDEDVDVLELLQNLLDSGLDLVVLRDVAADSHGADAELVEVLERQLEPLFAAGRNRDCGASLTERLGDLQPKAAATARDQGDFTVKMECVQNAHENSSVNATASSRSPAADQRYVITLAVSEQAPPVALPSGPYSWLRLARRNPRTHRQDRGVRA